MPPFKPEFRIEKPYRPQFPIAVQLAMKGVRPKRYRGRPYVFEFGGGHSTLWLSEFSTVHTAEHDEGWYDEIVRAAGGEGKIDVGLYQLHLVPNAITEYDYDFFDFVVVDCHQDYRVEAALTATKYIMPGGFMFIDDSDRPELARVCADLEKEGWYRSVIHDTHFQLLDGRVKERYTDILRRPEG